MFLGEARDRARSHFYLRRLSLRSCALLSSRTRRHARDPRCLVRNCLVTTACATLACRCVAASMLAPDVVRTPSLVLRAYPRLCGARARSRSTVVLAVRASRHGELTTAPVARCKWHQHRDTKDHISSADDLWAYRSSRRARTPREQRAFISWRNTACLSSSSGTRSRTGRAPFLSLLVPCAPALDPQGLASSLASRTLRHRFAAFLSYLRT